MTTLYAKGIAVEKYVELGVDQMVDNLSFLRAKGMGSRLVHKVSNRYYGLMVDDQLGSDGYYMATYDKVASPVSRSQELVAHSIIRESYDVARVGLSEISYNAQPLYDLLDRMNIDRAYVHGGDLGYGSSWASGLILMYDYLKKSAFPTDRVALGFTNMVEPTDSVVLKNIASISDGLSLDPHYVSYLFLPSRSLDTIERIENFIDKTK